MVVAGDEIIVNAEQGGRDGLAVYALPDGQLRGWSALPAGWEAMRGPVAAEAHGRTFLVVPLAQPEDGKSELDVGQRQGALAILDAGEARELLFSANILQSEVGEGWQLSTRAAIPGPGLASVCVIAAALVVTRRRQEARRRD